MSKNFEVLGAYNHIAFLYDFMNFLYFLGSDNQVRSRLIESLDILSGNIVLDICCGTGLNLTHLVKNKNTGAIIGLDLSSNMIKVARKNHNDKKISYINADATHIPLRNKIIDDITVAFCVKMIPEYKLALNEMKRILKPDGKLGVLANHIPNWRPRIIATIYSNIIGWMSKVNFKIDLKIDLVKDFDVLKDNNAIDGLIKTYVLRKKS